MPDPLNYSGGDHGPGTPDNDLIVQGADEPEVPTGPDNTVTDPQVAPQVAPEMDDSTETIQDPTSPFDEYGAPRNRMVEENGRDLDAISNTTQRRQGNALGLSRKAAENFGKMYRNEAKELRRQADKADEQAEFYEQAVKDMDAPQEGDPSKDAGVQKDKAKS